VRGANLTETAVDHESDFSLFFTGIGFYGKNVESTAKIRSVCVSDGRREGVSELCAPRTQEQGQISTMPNSHAHLML
jgi:hypothetical protein